MTNEEKAKMVTDSITLCKEFEQAYDLNKLEKMVEPTCPNNLSIEEMAICITSGSLKALDTILAVCPENLHNMGAIKNPLNKAKYSGTPRNNNQAVSEKTPTKRVSNKPK